MKQGWVKKKLVDACDLFTDGNWIESKDQSLEGIRLIQTGNVGNGEYKDKKGKERFVSQETFDRLKCTEIFQGDILISRLPEPVGRSCIIPDTNSRLITAVDCTIVRTSEELLPEFLRYFQLSSAYLKDVNSKVTGTTRSRISRKNLGLIEIPVPPLEEQKRIVAKLDQCFEAIDKAKVNAAKNLENAKELFQSKLNEIFSQKGEGWVEKKLGDVCKTGAGGTPLKSKKEYYINGDVPWLVSGEVKQGNVFKSKKFITQEGLNNSSAKLFPKNTVLVAMYGATAGDVGILRFESSTNQAVCGILPNDKFLPEFVSYSFQYKKDELISKATGNAQPNISQIKIKNTLIPVLSIKEQNKIVQLLDKLKEQTQSLESKYQQELNSLEELKKSILQKAFEGEL